MNRSYLYGAILALTANVSFACNPHTQHDVISYQGSWQVTLQLINQIEHGQLVDRDCQPIKPTVITPSKPLTYAFTHDGKGDFNIAYSITAVEQSTSFDRKACVFIATAKGPAIPDMRITPFNGAKCQVVNGEFLVS